MIPPELFRTIRRLEVRTRGLVDSVFGGAYHSAFKGRGVEFADLRPYAVGDDVRTIDWNVAARTGEPYVKLFSEEREQTLVLAVDVSGSTAFGSATATKRERAAEVCAVLGFSALRNNDRVGLLLFSDRVERYVAPAKGRRHVLRLVRDLYVHTPAGRGTDPAGALETIAHVIRRRAIVVLVSDFLVPPERAGATARALRIAAERHDLVALRLVDPREGALPDAGLVQTVDAESGRTVVLDTGSRRVRDAFAARAAERALATDALLASARVDGTTVRTDEDYADALAAFFRRRNQTRAGRAGRRRAAAR